MNRDQAMRIVGLAQSTDAAAALRDVADQIVPAIEFLIETDRPAALRLVGALVDYWQQAGRTDEGRALTERAIEGSHAAANPQVAAVIPRALLAASRLALGQGDQAQATKRANDCVRASILIEDRVTASLAHLVLAQVARQKGDASEAERHSRKALELDGPQASASQASATSAPACDCGADGRIATHFDHMTRERTEDGKVLPPMVAVTERLLAQLSDVATARPSILELGCGSAALLVTLLTRGAVSGDGYDLSPEAIATAQKRAADAGVADRAHFEVADAARATQTKHDWVILDRAICCYPDMPRLMDAALSANPARVAFSVPTSRGLSGIVNKVSWGFESFLTRFQKGACPGYVHSVDDIERRLSSAGFRRTSANSSLLWYTAVWDRTAA